MFLSVMFIWKQPAVVFVTATDYPDSKVHGAYMWPIWGQQDPGGPHVGPMNLAIRVVYSSVTYRTWISNYIYINYGI